MRMHKQLYMDPARVEATAPPPMPTRAGSIHSLVPAAAMAFTSPSSAEYSLVATPASARWAAALEAGTRNEGEPRPVGGRGGWQSGGQRTGLCQVGRRSGSRDKKKRHEAQQVGGREGGRGGWQSGGQRTGLCQVGRHSGAREKGVQEHWQAGGREAGECYGRCRGQPRAAGTLLLQRRLHPKLPKKDRKKGEKDAHRGRDLRKPDAPRAPPAPPATTPSCQPTTPVGPRMPALTLG